MAWELLERGAADAGDDLHWPVLASVDGHASGAPMPDARTVVLRAANRLARRLEVFSDLRAHKAAQLRAQPRVCLVFYHRRHDIQLRVRARAVLHAGDAIARDAWQTLAASSRCAYLAPLPPGSESPVDDPNLPVAFRERLPDATQSQPGFAHFLLIALHVHGIDWLRLGRAGHQRARFDWPHTPTTDDPGNSSLAPSACWLRP